MNMVIGTLLAIGIAWAAYVLRALSRDGAIAATFLGAMVFGFGGWPWAVVLLTFFLTSSILSRALRGANKDISHRYAKGGRRDAGQVIGNGGAAALFVLLHLVFPGQVWVWAAYAAAIAGVNADTWATELGALSRRAPRLITNLPRTVDKGTSGAISLEGSGAALAGSGLIAGVAVLLGQAPSARLFWTILVSGFLGSAVDSLLGATVQSLYRCTREGVETEQHPVHRCGSPTVRVRGWSWLDNDGVNFACGAFSALAAAVLTLVVAGR
jgi:uncharacterized protein (TIGR00297 family)